MKMTSTIKTFSLLLLYIVSFWAKAGATIFTVNVSNFQFSPANIPNVVVGDTIRWVWENGGHTTTCNPSTDPGTSLPAGAATWNASLNSGSTAFEYKVNVAGTYNYLCRPHAPDMAGSFTASEVLPVRLSEFKVANENNTAVLKWITQSEENTDYFSILKSNTGADFAEIGRVAAAGHSSVAKAYTFTDPYYSASDKYYYYTIAIVDKGGKKEFSPVALFKNRININKLILSMSPNPIERSGHLMLKFNADKKSEMKVKILSMEGRVVLQTTMQANEGVNNGHLMPHHIAPGSYSVIFELNGIKEVHKLVVR